MYTMPPRCTLLMLLCWIMNGNILQTNKIQAPGTFLKGCYIYAQNNRIDTINLQLCLQWRDRTVAQEALNLSTSWCFLSNWLWRRKPTTLVSKGNVYARPQTERADATLFYIRCDITPRCCCCSVWILCCCFVAIVEQYVYRHNVWTEGDMGKSCLTKLMCVYGNILAQSRPHQAAQHYKQWVQHKSGLMMLYEKVTGGYRTEV